MNTGKFSVKSCWNGTSRDRAPRGRARDGLAAGEKLETKPTLERSLSNMSSWVRGDREWV